MNFKKILLYITIALAAVVIFLQEKNKRGVATAAYYRNYSSLHFSRHARCRMDCRNISEQEIKEVIKHGVLNNEKSDLQREECEKRYALDETVNGQNIRIVFANCHDKITIITCIDTKYDWQCHCPGDK